jgi:hypothetical protein
MHSVDAVTEQIIRSVMAQAENRVRLDPVSLDGRSRPPEEFDLLTAGVIGEGPRHPDEILGLYASLLAPSLISTDSPRFLGFIPAAPT